MKLLIIFSLLVMSCTSKSVNLQPRGEDEMQEKSGYKSALNSTNTYILYYKVNQEIDTPVKIFSYWVKEKSTGKTILKETEMAAEQIYWKNADTLAIIPYHDAIRAETVPGASTVKEILIKIKP